MPPALDLKIENDLIIQAYKKAALRFVAKLLHWYQKPCLLFIFPGLFIHGFDLGNKIVNPAISIGAIRID